MTVSNNAGDLKKAPALCSQRWNLSILCFFGLLFVYLLRVNFSVAIICMVRAARGNVTAEVPVNESHGRLLNDVTPRPVTAITYPSLANQEERPATPAAFEPHDEKMGDESSCSTETVNPAAPSNQAADANKKPFLRFDTLDIEVVLSKDPSLPLQVEMNVDSWSRIRQHAILSQEGEFDWDKATQSRLLAMYFYGYIFTEVPGGWMAGRYGGRRVWGVCQAISALCALATPLAARSNVYIVYALRFILGLAAGMSFPCVHSMMGRWAPKLERSKLVAFSFTGMSVGTVLTFSLSALLCVWGFDNGWGSIFYLSGIGNLLWVVVWFVVTADTPAKHKRISEAERSYILSSIGEAPETKAKVSTPWLAIFKSGPVWAIVCAHMLHNYSNYTLLTSLPKFMKEVLNFDIKQNGGLSALPYLCQTMISISSGQVADTLRERGILSTKNTRKLFQVSSFIGSAVCIASAGYMTCTQRPLAVFLLCLCLSFMGLNRSGFGVNHIDLAPRHAGVLYGITNTVATVPGMVAPLVVGALTPNSTAEEWRRVFFVCSALAVLGAILYGALADGELQSWAVPPSVELDVVGGETTENRDEHSLKLMPEPGKPAGLAQGEVAPDTSRVTSLEKLAWKETQSPKNST